MKKTALKFLVCPACKADLELIATEHEGTEIVQGTLSCQCCHKAYPISKGVPRFVETGGYASSFGRQWNWFKTVQLDSLNGTNESERTLQETTGWTDQDYAGRLVLDAGVGTGRFAEIVARKGGEVVGIDLSNGVDAAFLNIGRHEKVHLLQSDIFAMPFRDATFDLAYSIGVLDHTPSPAMAFKRVAETVKEGGGLGIYVYSAYLFANYSSDVIRKVTTRLPMGIMFAVCALSIPLYYLYRVPVIGKALHFLFPVSMHPRWRWRWLDTLDWYSPQYQWKLRYPEVFGWFRTQGFHDVTVFDDPIRMRGIKTRAGTTPRLKPRQSFASGAGRAVLHH